MGLHGVVNSSDEIIQSYVNMHLLHHHTSPATFDRGKSISTTMALLVPVTLPFILGPRNAALITADSYLEDLDSRPESPCKAVLEGSAPRPCFIAPLP